MENIFYTIMVILCTIGWYFFIKETIYKLLFNKIKVDDDIKLQVIVKNKENNIEIITRKIMYLQNQLGYFKNIEIIDNNSIDDTYKILKKIETQYPELKVRKIL